MLLFGTLLTSDKEKIAYYHYKNDFPKVVIIAHGFYNSKDALLLQELALALGEEYDIFMFDFRGHSRSSGLFTWMSKEGEDLKAVLEYLEDKYKKIGLIAFSLGASISINTLGEVNSVDSFICVSAASSFGKIDYKFWELDWENDFLYTLFTKEGRKGKGVRPGPFWLPKKRPLDSVKKVRAPILYLHGERDWVIKPWHSKVLYEATNSIKELIILENGPHAEYLIKEFPEKVVTIVIGWFKETLGGE